MVRNPPWCSEPCSSLRNRHTAGSRPRFRRVPRPQRSEVRNPAMRNQSLPGEPPAHHRRTPPRGSLGRGTSPACGVTVRATGDTWTERTGPDWLDDGWLTPFQRKDRVLDQARSAFLKDGRVSYWSTRNSQRTNCAVRTERRHRDPVPSRDDGARHGEHARQPESDSDVLLGEAGGNTDSRKERSRTCCGPPLGRWLWRARP